LSGIYIHIPFCKKICYYCDFYFSLNLANKLDIVQAICTELELRKHFYSPETVIQTIYFGGGTPSVLTAQEIAKILNSITEFYTVSPEAEITFECNPDDLTLNYCQDLHVLGINRLSIGIQSFHDKDLEVMNRRHNSYEAEAAVLNAKQAGFNNITIDVMYGLPGMTPAEWDYTLSKVAELDVQHISAYALTIEPKTAFSKFVKNGRIKIPKDEGVVQYFERLIEFAKEQGFEHYEISNFAKDGMYSKHNTSYWQQKKYLGVGASAHSFNGEYRMWNISNNRKYIESIMQGIVPNEEEKLSQIDRYNEYIMTSLRTKWGVNIEYLKKNFEKDYYRTFAEINKKYIAKGLLQEKENSIILTNKGVMLSDAIMSDFFIV